MGFPKRKKLHDEICIYVNDFFNQRGYSSCFYGYEYSIAKKILHNELLKIRETSTASFIRHQPDGITIINNKAFFWEVKTLIKYKTPNFSIEIESYNTCKELYKLGHKTIFIFNSIPTHPFNLRACTIQDIKIHKKYDGQDTNGGSGTPFGLISKNNTYMKSLEDFIIFQQQKRSGEYSSYTDLMKNVLSTR